MNPQPSNITAIAPGPNLKRSRNERKLGGWAAHIQVESPSPLPIDSDMMYANTAREALDKRRTFLKKWRLKCRGVADSLEEAGDRLFTFLRYPPSQWKSLRTTNAIERLHEEFKRRIKIQCVLPSAETACMLFWALLACGQINLRRVDGWDMLHLEPDQQPLDLAA